MMSSYLRNDRRKARKRLLLATLIVGVIFILDILSGGFLRGIVRTASAAVWSAGSRIESVVFGSGFFSSRRALQAENDALKGENAGLRAEASGIEALKKENTELRGLVHLAEAVNGITAPIISSVRSSPYGTFMVGAGTAEGVTAHSIVLAGGERGFVIGQVAEAGAHSALVQEIFAPGASTEGSVRDAELVFEGQGGGNARGQAPRTLAVSEGDPVTSTVFGGRLIGVVGAVPADSASAYKSIYVRTPVGLSELQFVYVVPSSE